MSSEQHTVEYALVESYPAYRVGTDGSVWTRYVRVGNGNLHGSHMILGDVWRRLTAFKDKDGYARVGLRPPFKQFAVHRLVLNAFVGPCPPGMQCRHFPDRDRSNCALSNIQWGTAEENMADKSAHGTATIGVKNHFAKLTEDDVREVVSLSKAGRSGVSIARNKNVDPGTIYAILSGKNWKHLTGLGA